MGGLAGYLSARNTLDAGIAGERLLLAMPQPKTGVRSLFSEGGMTLLHSGTAVAGTGKGGRPLSRRFGTHTLTAALDGQLYNAGSLRETLAQKGHAVHTLCDVELALLSYVEWGQDAPAHMEGVFAFVVWDSGQRELYLARDRMGVKPLYVARPEGLPLFATDPAVLLKHPKLRRILPAEGVCRLLCPAPGEPYGPEVLEDVDSLPPGHWMRWREGEWTTGCYWRPDIHIREHSQEAAMSLFQEGLYKALLPRKEGASPFRSVPNDPVIRLLEAALPNAEALPLIIWDGGTPPPEHAAVITGDEAALDFTDAVLLGGRPDFTVEEAVLMLLWRQAAKRCTCGLSAVGGYTLLSGKPPRPERLPRVLLQEPYRQLLLEMDAAKGRRLLSGGTATSPRMLMQMVRPLPERAERLGVYAGVELRMPFADPGFVMSMASLSAQNRAAILDGGAFPALRAGKGWEMGIHCRFQALLCRSDCLIWQLCRRELLCLHPATTVLQARLLMVNLWLERFEIRLG